MKYLGLTFIPVAAPVGGNSFNYNFVDLDFNLPVIIKSMQMTSIWTTGGGQVWILNTKFTIAIGTGIGPQQAFFNDTNNVKITSVSSIGIDANQSVNIGDVDTNLLQWCKEDSAPKYTFQAGVMIPTQFGAAAAFAGGDVVESHVVIGYEVAKVTGV